jgi:hypothetical protein
VASVSEWYNRAMSIAGDTVLLDGKDLKFFRAPEGDIRLRLSFKDEWCCREVRVAQLLPLSLPSQYWAIRDGEDKEIGILQDLSELDTESRRTLEEEISRHYFLPKVLSVQKVRDEYGVIVWDVTTDAGEKRYTVRNLRDSSVALSITRVLMTDVDGNRFEFPNIDLLSTAAQDVLLKVV